MPAAYILVLFLVSGCGAVTTLTDLEQGSKPDPELAFEPTTPEPSQPTPEPEPTVVIPSPVVETDDQASIIEVTANPILIQGTCVAGEVELQQVSSDPNEAVLLSAPLRLQCNNGEFSVAVNAPSDGRYELSAVQWVTHLSSEPTEFEIIFESPAPVIEDDSNVPPPAVADEDDGDDSVEGDGSEESDESADAGVNPGGQDGITKDKKGKKHKGKKDKKHKKDKKPKKDKKHKRDKEDKEDKEDKDSKDKDDEKDDRKDKK